ncbi:hypothetical protein IAI18_10090 [Acetobacteraceae bacterium H6797]|nr:hypothetical protein [Acetobacteraceae bacterium H6797]
MPIADQPCRGLIFALALPSVGEAPRRLQAEEIPALLAAETRPPLWLHFDLVDTGAQAFLRKIPGLSGPALAALLEGDDHIHLEEAEGILFGAIPDFHADAPGHEPDTLGMLHLAMRPGLLVTARRHPLRAVRLYAEAAPDGRLPPAGSVQALLGALLRLIADDLMRGRQALATQLTHIEDALLRPRHIPDRGQLTSIRRDVLRLTRRFTPIAEALDEMSDDPPPWLADASGFWREARRLCQARSALESLQDRARVAQDGHATRVAEETNRRLFMLSVLSAAMLPASVVTGIFGMNVGGLPGVDQPWGIWLALILVGLSIGGVLAVLRFFRLL